MVNRFPYYISALIDGFAGSQSIHHKDSYGHPTEISFTFEQISGDKHAILTPASVSVAKHSMEQWSDVAKVTWKLDNRSPEIHLLRGPNEAEYDGLTESRTPTAPPQFRHNRMFYRPLNVLLQEQHLAKARIERRDGFIKYVIGHELGHVLELAHPFRFEQNYRDTILPRSQHSTWFSLMSYNPLMTKDNLPIYRISPSAFDIAAVQHIYTQSQSARPENTLYDLTKGVESSPKQYTVETIYDTGGSDTLSAEGYAGDALFNLRQGVREYSLVGNKYYTLAFNTHIENVIGGEGRNRIYLNSLNNHVDIQAAKKAAVINVFCYDKGTAVIKGFNPKRGDRLIVEKVKGDTTPVKFTIESIEPSDTLVTVNGKKIKLENVPSTEIAEQSIKVVEIDSRLVCPVTDAPITNSPWNMHLGFVQSSPRVVNYDLINSAPAEMYSTSLPMGVSPIVYVDEYPSFEANSPANPSTHSIVPNIVFIFTLWAMMKMFFLEADNEASVEATPDSEREMYANNAYAQIYLKVTKQALKNLTDISDVLAKLPHKDIKKLVNLHRYPAAKKLAGLPNDMAEAIRDMARICFHQHKKSSPKLSSAKCRLFQAAIPKQAGKEKPYRANRVKR